MKDARTKKGPVFRLVKVMVEKLEFVMPPQDGAHLKDRFRQALLGSAVMDYAPFPADRTFRQPARARPPAWPGGAPTASAAASDVCRSRC